jgi:hypothetical protein
MRVTGRAAVLLVAIILGSVIADAARAQAASSMLRVGDRVRLIAPTVASSPVVGFIVSADRAQLTVDVAQRGEAASEWSIDWEAITRIERSNGYQSNTGKGAWTGLGLGVLTGAGLWFLAAQNSGEVVPPLGTPLWYGALGALGGAIIGSGGSRERWSSLPTDARMGLQLSARPAQLAGGVPDSVLRVGVATGVLKVGDRVRLIAPTQSPSPVVGRLASGDDSQLTVVVSEETRMARAVERTIDRESLTLIERREAFKSKAGTGALIGGTLGLLAGVGVGYAAALAGENSQPLITAPLTFGAMGVLAGAGIGAAISSERWRALPPDTQVGFRPGMGTEPFAVVIRTTF